MLGKPQSGWTKITVGYKYLGTASYLDDVPMLCLETFLAYFTPSNIKREDGKVHIMNLPFSIVFDAEGYYFGITEWNDTLYYIHDHTKNGDPVMDELVFEDSTNRVYDNLKLLAKECIKDIEENLEDWVRWIPEIEEYEDLEQIKFRRTLIKTKISVLEEFLKD